VQWQAVLITLQLALTTTVLLLIVGIPLAWWLAHHRSLWRVLVEALVAMPLILPPTVLGFYLLILFSANGWFGQWWQQMFGTPLAFSFSGLVIASMLYSLPFVVQPLHIAFEGMNKTLVEAAYTLGASKFKTIRLVMFPQVRRGFLTAIVLGFAHTVGEFGVVLMVGGNIPGTTQVVSIAIYEYVETLEYGLAHQLSLGLLMFSFLVLLIVYALNRRWQLRSVK